MDAAGIAAFLVSAQRQDTRLAVTTAMIRQQKSQDDSLLKLLGDGLDAGQALQAAAPDGMGASLDVTV